MNAIFNHLWQSTLFAAAVALASIALRHNSPRLRYWLWLAASLKFLIPFSLLVSTGARIQVPPATPSLHAATVQQISTYFAPVSVFSAAVPARAEFRWPELLAAIWIAGALFLLIRWFLRWRAIHLAASQATRLPLRYLVPAFASPSMMEPGIFGISRPVLLLPEGITDRLTPEQFEAILNHELCHLRYRDNLTAALHMCVETLFWFHPLVWWIGAQLIAERERDCDEAVLMQGSRPGDYARGIVQVCETYVDSRLPCASGISGADLNKRIREIMTWQGSLPITLRAKAILATATLAAISVPFVIGILRAQTLLSRPAYTYEVASIHKSDPASRNVHMGDDGPHGGLRTVNTSVAQLIGAAYDVQDYQVLGAPGWVSSEHFDVIITPDIADVAHDADKSLKDFQTNWSRDLLRLRAVLHNRFGLVLHTETRELPIYSLLQAKNGHKLSPHDGTREPSIETNGDRQITGEAATMEMLAGQLSMQLRRPVHNDTHLEGQYDLQLDWTPDLESATERSPQRLTDVANRGSIFTAITDQLGLRLESTKGPVQVYVVDRIEQPTDN